MSQPTLCFATRNRHKIEEIALQLRQHYRLVALDEVGCLEEIPEDEPTIEANSLFKAMYVYKNYGADCFADDSGLEVEGLNGAPGVHSAYYAGPQRSFTDNMALVLQQLQGQANRKAQFKTCITLVLAGKPYQFTGIVPGQLLESPRGSQGFGYDPIFVPEGHTRTFAEMALAEKNAMSHRAKAVQQLLAFLQGPAA